MSSSITTIAFLILALVSSWFVFVMYIDRAKFIRTIKGQKGLFFSFNRTGPDELLTIIQICLPIKLEATQDEKIKELRDAAVKSTRHVIIAFLVTVTFPLILFNILEWVGI